MEEYQATWVTRVNVNDVAEGIYAQLGNKHMGKIY